MSSVFGDHRNVIIAREHTYLFVSQGVPKATERYLLLSLHITFGSFIFIRLTTLAPKLWKYSTKVRTLDKYFSFSKGD